MKTLFVSKTRKEKSGFASKSVKYFLFIFLLFPSFSLYPDTSENYCHTILFLKDKYDLNYELKHNAEIIAQIDSLIHFYYTHHRIDSLFLSASASFDGGSETNESLSAKRSGAIKKYLLENFPYLDQYPIRISKTGEDWDGFKEMVVVDENVPDKKNLLDIIDNPYWTSEQKEARIRQLAKGDTYNYLSENILPFQRKALICISFSLLTPPPPPAHHNQLINSRLRRNSAIIAEQEEFSISPDSRPTIEKPKLGGIKTNLILLGAGLANIGIEHPLGDRFSVDLSFIYSPYTIKRDWKFRTLGIQPELRWWWKESMKGHFLGLHGHLLYYNVAWDDLDRYQDREGRTPLWGAGLSYGYTLPVHKRWNLEFTIGAGYAHLIYDSFYNVGNGAKYSTDTKDYWGITRVGITLVYKLKMD